MSSYTDRYALSWQCHIYARPFLTGMPVVSGCCLVSLASRAYMPVPRLSQLLLSLYQGCDAEHNPNNGE